MRKNSLAIFTTLLLIFLLSSCNFFDFMDPNINHFDRCKSYNDKGDFQKAIEACEKADPDGENVDVQLELADALLGSIGIGIEDLSDVFMNEVTSTNLIVSLANSIINRGLVNQENGVQSRLNAEKATNTFDIYGALLGNDLESRQVATFYSLLSRLCQVALLMAYSDIDADNPNGEITADDICRAGVAGCEQGAATICTGTTCEGMSTEDAAVVAETMLELKGVLSIAPEDGGIPIELNTGSVEDMIDIEVLIGGVPVPISLVPTNMKADAGRNMLLQMIWGE